MTSHCTLALLSMCYILGACLRACLPAFLHDCVPVCLPHYTMYICTCRHAFFLMPSLILHVRTFTLSRHPLVPSSLRLAVIAMHADSATEPAVRWAR